MSLRLKIFISGLSLLSFFAAMGAPRIYANPFEELTPDQQLYQRVKKLGDYGLLDPQDKAVLDQGKVVTRLELAFYTEKAKAKISAPQLGEPQQIQPTPTPQPALELMTLPPAMAATPTPEPMTLPPAVVATPIPAPAMQLPVTSDVRNEIDELLKELKQEAAYLQTRLALNDQRIKDQEKELEDLQNAQDEVNSIWKKANKSSGSPNFSTKERFRVENLGLEGPLTVMSATRTVSTVELGMWSDLGGKGAISLGIIGYLSDANASAGPVSLGIYAPDVNYSLSGPLGNWDTHFTVQAYPAAGSLGDFTRGIAATTLKRYQNPADIKPWSDDKDIKTWDDYISNISPVPPASAGGAIVSSFDRVFDGVYGVGSNLPLLGSDAHMILMAGRYGGDTPNRWEESAKITKPLGVLQTELSTEWINDNFGVNQLPQLDLKSYEANFSLNLNPVQIGLEAGLSSLYSGLDNGVPTNTALEGYAGQASLAFYPFNLFYTAISPDFSNFSSKVAMAGVNFSQYGVYYASKYNASDFIDDYGLIGEVDNLISDRYGWRANVGWNGRKQDWMKSWPSFLDDIVVNFDVSQKHEYRAVYSSFQNGTNVSGNPNFTSHNVIEAFNIISPYYVEDEGIWGLDDWGGYAAAPWLPARQQYVTNIQNIRNDGDPTGDEVRYQFRLSSERIPLIQPVLQANGQPMTYTAGTAPVPAMVGQNEYTDLSELKSYNYITLTTKWQLNKTLGISNPFYASFFFTDNSVAGTATVPTQSNISSLFDQSVYEITGLFQLFKNVNLMGDYGWEVWKSDYTYPLIDYRTDAVGGGLAYDIPWGGAKFELRYKHVTFKDTYVPANNYQTDQWISEIYVMF